MPEGDTIHKIAAFMAPKLTGETLKSARVGTSSPLTGFDGARIQRVEARGKHLWIGLDNGTGIRSHLGMHGSWHVYGPDEPWQRPERQASIVLDAAQKRWVCFNAKEVEIVDTPGIRERLLDKRLGPDLIADEISPELIVARAREFDDGDALLIDTLLDQRVASGIGNVYKSEVMFIRRVEPTRMTHASSDAEIAECFATAAKLLKDNLGGGKRVTRRAPDQAGIKWVYGRTGMPCHECDTPIRSQRMGHHHRGTYWCPRCQSSA